MQTYLFFKPPSFLLTIKCVCETDAFLRQFIREVGVSLGSTASCRRLLRTRLGPFDNEHSLLDKHFTLKNILANMTICKRVLDTDKENLVSDVINKRPRISASEALGEQLYEAVDADDGDDEQDEIEDCLRVPWGRTYST